MPADITLTADHREPLAAIRTLTSPRPVTGGLRWTPRRGFALAIASSAVAWIGLGLLLIRLL